MSKVKIIVARGKVFGFDDVPDEAPRNNYLSFSSMNDFSNFCTEANLALNKSKIAVSYSSNVIMEAAIVPLDHQDPVEYLFDTKEEADKFVERQGYGQSVHLMESEIQEIVHNFFGDSDCDFKDCEKLREEYKEEMSKADNDPCPSCVTGAVMRKYQDIIVKILEEQIKEEK